jgi:hypothetical protein
MMLKKGMDDGMAHGEEKRPLSIGRRARAQAGKWKSNARQFVSSRSGRTTNKPRESCDSRGSSD